MVLEVAKTTSLLLLIALFAHMGNNLNYRVYYACGAVGVAFALSALSYLVAIAKVDGTPISKLMLPLVPPLLACIPMAFGVFEFQRLVVQYGGLPHPVMLVVEVIVGMLVFVPSAFLIAPGATRELIGLLRSARARRREKKDDDAAVPPEKAA